MHRDGERQPTASDGTRRVGERKSDSSLSGDDVVEGSRGRQGVRHVRMADPSVVISLFEKPAISSVVVANVVPT